MNIDKNTYLLNENYPYKIKYLGRVEQECVFMGDNKDKCNFMMINSLFFNSHGQNYALTAILERKDNKILNQESYIQDIDEFKIPEYINIDTLDYLVDVKYFLPKINDLEFLTLKELGRTEALVSDKFKFTLSNRDSFGIHVFTDYHNETKIEYEEFCKKLIGLDAIIQNHSISKQEIIDVYNKKMELNIGEI